MAAAAVLAAVIAGCGVEHRTVLSGVTQDELSAGGEPYFNAGPVTYQIQVSRQLNPFDSDDVQYLAGVKSAQNITAQQFWYGVFLWAKNQTNRDVTTSDHFELEDSNGDIFKAFPLNANLNPYAWTAQTLAPDDIEPATDTTAGEGPNGGGLILFRLTQAVYSNRPLTLLIFAPGSSKPSRVSLDL
jgi:hypothetical protein